MDLPTFPDWLSAENPVIWCAPVFVRPHDFLPKLQRTTSSTSPLEILRRATRDHMPRAKKAGKVLEASIAEDADSFGPEDHHSSGPIPVAHARPLRAEFSPPPGAAPTLEESSLLLVGLPEHEDDRAALVHALHCATSRFQSYRASMHAQSRLFVRTRNTQVHRRDIMVTITAYDTQEPLLAVNAPRVHL